MFGCKNDLAIESQLTVGDSFGERIVGRWRVCLERLREQANEIRRRLSQRHITIAPGNFDPTPLPRDARQYSHTERTPVTFWCVGGSDKFWFDIPSGYKLDTLSRSSALIKPSTTKGCTVRRFLRSRSAGKSAPIIACGRASVATTEIVGTCI